MRLKLLITCTVLLSCFITVKATDGITSPFVHDPVLAYDGSRYYIYCTGQGIQVYSSADLTKWRDEPSVFNSPPQWAMKMVPGYNGHTWAPDIIFYQGKYHLFYSCSTFGKNRSAIGHVEAAKHNLKGAPIVVAGGYGVGSKAGFDQLALLAKELHGEVGASRAAVDAGWVDHDRQIGQTGLTVHPKVYIACGISGQIQHISGMQDSGIIISINNDPDAPINKIADYIINGTVEEVVPKLIKYYKQNSK
jgi:Electron transfer flavoprotein, alpha subunit